MIATIPELTEIVERLAPVTKLNRRPVAGRVKVMETGGHGGKPRRPKGRATSVFRELLW